MTTAIDQKPSKRLLRALAYYAAFVALGLALSAFGPTLPSLAGQTGSTLGQISLIFAANSLGYIPGSLVGGWLFDRRRGHPVLAFTLAVLALLLLSVPLVSSRWLLVFIIFLIGFMMGILDVGGNTLIVWLFGSDVGPYMNALHLAFGIGALLSPLLTDWVVVSTGGIRWVFWSFALLIVPVIFWVARVPSPARPDEEENGSESASLRPYSLLILMVSALFFLFVGTELGYGGWVFSYAAAIQIGPDTVARLLNAVYWGGFTFGRLIAIPLAVKLRPKTMLFVDLVGAAISLGLMLLLPGWTPAVWIGTLGLGLSIASMFPAALNFAGRRMPITGRVTAYFLVGANAGSMTLPWVIGQLFEPVGPQSMLWVLTGAIGLGLLLFWGISAYAKKMDEIGVETSLRQP